jgi:hypothetical protein
MFSVNHILCSTQNRKCETPKQKDLEIEFEQKRRRRNKGMKEAEDKINMRINATNE